MSALKRGASNRSFEWGLQPQFSRSMFLSPPCGDSRAREVPAVRRSEARHRRERAYALGGLVASLGVHALLLVWSSSPVLSEGTVTAFARHRPSASVEMEVVHMREAVLQEASQPEERREGETSRPVARFEPPLLPHRQPLRDRTGPTLVRAQGRRSLDGIASLPGLGNGLGAGLGRGEDDGVGEGEGDGGDVYIAPRARSILRTWSPPPRVLGTRVLARVYTNEKGQAVGGFELIPPTSDRATNDEIAYRVRTLQYWPATINGEPVAAWAEVSFEFCYYGTTAASPPAAGFGDGVACQPPADSAKATDAAKTRGGG